jgi:hypothetical protein
MQNTNVLRYVCEGGGRRESISSDAEWERAAQMMQLSVSWLQMHTGGCCNGQLHCLNCVPQILQ